MIRNDRQVYFSGNFSMNRRIFTNRDRRELSTVAQAIVFWAGVPVGSIYLILNAFGVV